MKLKPGRPRGPQSSGPLDERYESEDEDMLFWSPFGAASSTSATGEWDLDNR